MRPTARCAQDRRARHARPRERQGDGEVCEEPADGPPSRYNSSLPECESLKRFRLAGMVGEWYEGLMMGEALDVRSSSSASRGS